MGLHPASLLVEECVQLAFAFLNLILQSVAFMRVLLIRGESVITVADSLPKATQPVSVGRVCRGGH